MIQVALPFAHELVHLVPRRFLVSLELRPDLLFSFFGKNCIEKGEAAMRFGHHFDLTQCLPIPPMVL